MRKALPKGCGLSTEKIFLCFSPGLLAGIVSWTGRSAAGATAQRQVVDNEQLDPD